MAVEKNPVRALAASNARLMIDWAVAALAKPLPEPVRLRAATILADDIGAMVAGSLEPQVMRAQQGLLQGAAAGVEASVFARNLPRVDKYSAASANGMSITWCELDEGFRNASCHGGAYTIPVLLAEAEARGATLEQVLRVVAIAYEVTTRFALAYPFPVFNVHPHAAFATIGAASAAALMRGYDAPTMHAAVTGAASMSFAGPFDTAVEGSLVRNGWTAAGNWVGMRAADWALGGIGGGADTPYDVFVGSFHTNARPAALIDDLGTVWSVANGYHKIFACCAYAHSAVEATLDLLGRMQQRKVDEIAEIVVETGPSGCALTTVDPQTVLAAKFSMPHAVAATTRMGTAGARAFTYDTLYDAGIAAMRRRVRMAPFKDLPPFPNDRPARVTWRFADGAEMTAVCESARGGANQPFELPTLLAKLNDNAGGVFPALPPLMAAIINGDAALAARPWRDVVAEMLRNPLPATA